MNEKLNLHSRNYSSYLVFALALIFVTGVNFSVSAQDSEIYALGEKIKIDLEGEAPYSLKIQTPSKSFLHKSEDSSFIFVPKETGPHNIGVISENVPKSYSVIIVDSEELGGKSDKIFIPLDELEDTSSKQIVSSESVLLEENPSKKMIRIGEPVIWREKLEYFEGKNSLQIKIPQEATNISLGDIGGKAEFKVKYSLGEKALNLFSKKGSKTIVALDPSRDLEISYQTPGPQKSEKKISKTKKEVKIFSDYHYQNVLASTKISEPIPYSNVERIRVYWREEKTFLPFEAFDENNDSLIDKIEWNVPHLSEQNFEIIVIIGAEHLDSNRNFIKNIYAEVSELDNLWSLIPAGDFVRVTFEKNLTSKNDITLFAESAANEPAIVEVYEKDSNVILAVFEEIVEPSFYKIFLTNLLKPQDTFDLKILGDILIDLIIDPTYLDHFTGFEADTTAPWDGWSDGGQDVARVNTRSQCTDTVCAGGGTWSLEIQDDSATSVSEQTFDLSNICGGGACDSVSLSFWAFFETTIDDGEELDVKCDGTTIWSCYPNDNNDPADDSSQCAGTGVENTWNFYTINLSSPEFGSCTIDSSVVLRFESEYSANGEESWIDGINITGYGPNIPPIDPSPELNSTDGTNLSSQDLNCFDTAVDPNGDSMNVTVRWYKDDVLNLSIDLNDSYANGTFGVTSLASANTTTGEEWICSLRFFDGTDYSNWTNSSSVTILSTPDPLNVTIISPTPQSYSTSLLDFNVSLNNVGSSCFYSLDSAPNITMNQFNTTYYSVTGVVVDEGTHTVEFYCNDTFASSDSANNSFLINVPTYKTIAEFGLVEDLQEGSWSQIIFNTTFEDSPVVVHQVEYNYSYDSNPCATRIRNVNTTGFELRSESWTSGDSCPATGVHGYWIAMEKGVHNISDNGTVLRQVEATNFSMDVNACGSGAGSPSGWNYAANYRNFLSNWTTQPFVFGSVQSANDLDVITHYIKGCSASNTDSWTNSCVEIGLNGMENDGAVQPCNLHTSDEEGGYIAIGSENNWTDAETQDHNGTSDNGIRSYSWQTYWEEDNVQGSQNDAYPMGSYSVTLPQSYERGVAFASGIRIDGGNGLFPTLHWGDASDTIFLLAEEDEYGDTEQSHGAEPFEVWALNTSSGYLYSDEITPLIEIVSPINGTTYGVDTVDFNVSLGFTGDTCSFSLDGAANVSMTSISPTYFNYTQTSLSDTSHNVTFYCNDTFGGNYVSDTTFFTVDSTPLVIDIVSPLNQTYTSSFIDFNVSTNKATTQCFYSLNGAANTTMTLVNTTYFAYEEGYLREGDYEVEYYCDTGFGSTDTANASFAIDTGAILNVSRGFTSIASGETEVNVSLSVTDISKAFLTFSSRSSASAPSQLHVLGQLQDGQITFSRYSTTGSVEIEWEVIESPDLYVQRKDTVYVAGESEFIVPINQVNLTESFTITSGKLDSGTTSQNVMALWTSNFSNSTIVSFNRGTAGITGEVQAEVVEWDGITVQSGTSTGTGGSVVTSFGTAVNLSRSFIIASSRASSATSLQDTSVRASFADNQNVSISRGGTGGTFWTEWYVLEDAIFEVQNGSTSVSGSTPINTTILPVTLNESFSFKTRDSTGGGTTFANSLETHVIINTTTLQFEKGTGSQTQVVDWFVIDIGAGDIEYITPISPLNQTYSTSSLDFNVSLASPGSWCGLSLDGAANVSMNLVNSTYFGLVQGPLSAGSHEVLFFCNDTGGTNYASETITFSIDLTAPTVTSINPSNNSVNTSNTIDFFYNVTDNLGIASCSLIIDEAVHATDTSIQNGTTQSFNTFISNGVHDWSVNCTDGGGLTNSSEIRSINVSGPDFYAWDDRWYETSLLDYSLPHSNISLANVRDGTENNVTLSLLPSQVTTTVIGQSPFLGNKGGIIPASSSIDFSTYTTVSLNNIGYLTWKSYISNSSGDTLICQSGDDSTGGVRMSSATGTWTSSCTAPASDTRLQETDKLKLVINVYNDDTVNLTYSNVWDDLRLSFMEFANFTTLGELNSTLTYPLTNSTEDIEDVFNITCNAHCLVGECQNTQMYAQIYNTTSLAWEDIASTGNIILETGETNPHALGTIINSSTATNFTLRAKIPSSNTLRCYGVSDYSNNSNNVLGLQVDSANLPPEVYLFSPATSYFFNTTTVELFYNVTDPDDNVANTTLILDSQVNVTNSSAILNHQINNFTLILSEGSYNWTVNATDTLGLTGTNDSVRTFTVDATPPEISLHNPVVDESLSSVSVFFNFSGTDNIDTSLTCNLTVDSVVLQENFEMAPATPTNFTEVLGFGDHLWNVSCIDDASNYNVSTTRNFTVSDSPPTTLQLTANNTWFSSSNLNISYNVTDNDQITSCALYIGGVFNQSNASAIVQGEQNNFSLEGWSDALYLWSVECTDNAALSNSTENRTFYIDTQVPQVNLNLPLNATTSSFANNSFNFTAIDNLDSSMVCNLTIDSVVEGLNLVAPNSTLTNSAITGLTDGAKLWNVSCVDEAGNANTSITRQITIEEYPEIVLNTLNESWFFDELELDYTPTDNTGFAACNLIINGGVNQTNSSAITNGAQNQFIASGLSDAFYLWSVNCTDTYGLENSSIDTRVAYIDSQAPEITLSTPVVDENVFSGNVEFNFTVTDNLADQMYCNLTVDSVVVDSNFSALNATLTNRTNAVSPGNHLWNVTCWDIVGTTNTSETRNFTNFEAPSVSLDSPENNTWVNDSSVFVTYNVFDSDDNLANCSLYINGILNQTNSSAISNGEINNFTTTLAEGFYDWNVICVDETLLEGTDDPRNINVDTTNPEVTLNAPLPNSTETWNNVTFNFTASDNLDSVLNCSIIIDAFPEITEINVTNGSEHAEGIIRNDGFYEWQVQCVDEAQNSVTAPVRNFTVDAPPIISLNSPSDGNRTTLADVTLAYTPQDAIGLTQCDLYFDDVLNQTDVSVEKNEENYFSLVGMAEGSHNWTVNCTDTDSNTAQPTAYSLIRDLSPPVITLNAPVNDSGLDANVANVLFNWTATDALDTLLTCDLYIDGVINESSILVTSGVPNTESIGGISLGDHTWNVTCADQVDNSNSSVTWDFTRAYPDFMVNSSSIVFNNSAPTENESIQINASIYNLGAADSSEVEVKFYLGDPQDSGVEIGAVNTTIGKFGSNSSAISWTAVLGTSQIFVAIDTPTATNGSFTETNESNNEVSENLSVESWHFFYGDLTANSSYVLSDSSEYRVNVWNQSSNVDLNVYVADIDSVIEWSELQALGKNTSGQNSSSDFSELDTLLNMSSFSDSIEEVFLNASQPSVFRSYILFNNEVSEVRVADSINNSNFKTGILWDMSTDSNGEFDGVEKEGIIFVTATNKSSQGSYGVTDYELRVPAKLREYDLTTSGEVSFYMELTE